MKTAIVWAIVFVAVIFVTSHPDFWLFLMHSSHDHCKKIIHQKWKLRRLKD
ncbi:MAG: hypothetical protein LBO72_04870 [Helicobacteraceae bacterium]|nr:hypothetical protein [Helicobacteraceae bacterium]